MKGRKPASSPIPRMLVDLARACADDGTPFPPIKAVASGWGVHPATVSTYLGRLDDAGILVVSRHSGRQWGVALA